MSTIGNARRGGGARVVGRASPRTRAGRSGRRACSGQSRERGMVTVELAVSILTAALIAAGLCWVVGVVGAQIRCQDSAVAIARQLARGDEAGADRARAAVPPGSTVQVSSDGGVVQVTVHDELSWGRIGPVPVSGRATVTKEPHAVEQRP